MTLLSVIALPHLYLGVLSIEILMTVMLRTIQIQENHNRLILFCTFNRAWNNIRNWRIMEIRTNTNKK